jgi:hypothetical protein
MAWRCCSRSVSSLSGTARRLTAVAVTFPASTACSTACSNAGGQISGAGAARGPLAQKGGHRSVGPIERGTRRPRSSLTTSASSPTTRRRPRRRRGTRLVGRRRAAVEERPELHSGTGYAVRPGIMALAVARGRLRPKGNLPLPPPACSAPATAMAATDRRRRSGPNGRTVLGTQAAASASLYRPLGSRWQGGSFLCGPAGPGVVCMTPSEHGFGITGRGIRPG